MKTSHSQLLKIRIKPEKREVSISLSSISKTTNVIQVHIAYRTTNLNSNLLILVPWFLPIPCMNLKAPQFIPGLWCITRITYKNLTTQLKRKAYFPSLLVFINLRCVIQKIGIHPNSIKILTILIVLTVLSTSKSIKLSG